MSFCVWVCLNSNNIAARWLPFFCLHFGTNIEEEATKVSSIVLLEDDISTEVTNDDEDLLTPDAIIVMTKRKHYWRATSAPFFFRQVNHATVVEID